MIMKKMSECNLSGQRVLIREDLNVPIQDGKISSDARLRAALPSIKQALDAGAQVILMSHLGRPVEGEFDVKYSLAPVVDYLSEKMGCDVPLVADWQNGLPDASLILLENVRFNKGEAANDDALAKQYASLCDIFVMDAFGTAHRAQASTHGVAKFAGLACAGPLLAAEIAALDSALVSPAKPRLAIVGGSKVSTKLTILESLSSKVDQLIVGGGIANTFLAAAGFPVGKSLYEKDLISQAKALMASCDVPLPVDVVVGKAFSAEDPGEIKAVNDVADDDMIFDIGPKTSKMLADMILDAKTILWNGPVGVFEFSAFENGTRVISEAIAASKGFSLAGGGDTLSAIDQFDIASDVSYISTGGGAFLEYVEGKELPAVSILNARGGK